MKLNHYIIALVISLSALAAKADVIYVGSWSPYNNDAPVWYGYAPNGPLAYTGQEAAALLFGGVASDYYISTVSDQVADINHSAWYDVIGLGGGIYSEDYFSKYLGLYYGPTGGYNDGNLYDNAASAFIRDNGVSGTNYAFRVTNDVPESGATVALFGAGLLALAAVRRRKQA